MRKSAPVFFGVVVLAIVLGYVVSGRYWGKICQVSVSDGIRQEIYKCGIKYRGKSESNDAYIGKIERIYLRDNKVYMATDFGSTKVNLALGELGSDKVYINQLSTKSFTNEENVSESDYKVLDEALVGLYDAKYKGSYALLVLLGPDQISINTKQLMALESGSEKEGEMKPGIKKKLEYWNNCSVSYEKFWHRMREGNLFTQWFHMFDLKFDKQYAQCLPVIDTIGVYQ